MKTFRRSSRIGVLGLCLSGALASNLLAVSYVMTAPTSTSQWNNGIIYNVPAGAGYEWEVEGDAQILVGGGGLNVNETGASGGKYDVGNTAYADSISYQLNAYGSSGYALLYVGW